MRAVFNKSNGMKWGAILASGLLFALALPEIVDAANIRGKVSKGELLLNPVWEEARDPNSHRYTFREPSATVSAKMRKLFAHLPADVTVALLGDGAQASKANLRLAGGRGYPSTLVVAPGTELTLTNQDPFVHKPYVKGQSTFTAAVMQSDSTRTWQVPGPGVYELRDEAIPSVRIWIISEPKVVSAASPRRDGSFEMAAEVDGDYQLQAYFAGAAVGKPLAVTIKGKDIDVSGAPLVLAEETKETKEAK